MPKKLYNNQLFLLNGIFKENLPVTPFDQSEICRALQGHDMFGMQVNINSTSSTWLDIIRAIFMYIVTPPTIPQKESNNGKIQANTPSSLRKESINGNIPIPLPRTLRLSNARFL